VTPAQELHAAAAKLREVAPALGGFYSKLADPVADWLDSWTGIDLYEAGSLPEDARHALTIARAVLGTTP
jgi:hypothetical protein